MRERSRGRSWARRTAANENLNMSAITSSCTMRARSNSKATIGRIPSVSLFLSFSLSLSLSFSLESRLSGSSYLSFSASLFFPLRRSEGTVSWFLRNASRCNMVAPSRSANVALKTQLLVVGRACTRRCTWSLFAECLKRTAREVAPSAPRCTSGNRSRSRVFKLSRARFKFVNF